MPLPDDLDFVLVESMDEANALMRWLGERRPVLAVDTETSGLEWWDGDLRLVQFGDARKGWAVPFAGWGGLVKEALEKYAGQLAFHNAKFDLHWLERAGIKPKRHLVDDTALMVQLLEPNERFGLKPAGQRLIDPRAGQGQDKLKKAMTRAKWSWGTLPVELEEYWVYAAQDTVLTAHLWEYCRPRVVGDLGRVYDTELAVMMVLMAMEERGVHVDLDYAARTAAQMEDFAEEMRKYVALEYGLTSIGGQSLAGRLQQEGVVLTKKTAGGGWSMDEEVLSSISHPLAQHVLDIRKSEKLARTYFAAFAQLADGTVIHPSVNQVGAQTGRMSVSSPSLQNLPRGRVVRDAFVPQDGNVMVSLDYEQIEARLFTHFANDTEMAALFGGEVDFFTGMARRIYADESLVKDDPRRQITKNAMYAKIYGAGTAKFALTAGVSEGEAGAFLSQLDAAFPSLRNLQHQIVTTAKQRQISEGSSYVTTPYGRRQVADKGHEYKLVNYLIQGTAADVLKQVIVELDACDLTDYFVMPVHDELIFDVPEGEADELIRAVEEVMVRDDFMVQLRVDTHVGDRWGALK